jgi:hypothetical protein
MALTTRSAGTSPIDSSAVNQYYQALTGAMTDQTFTLANTLTVSKAITGSSNAAITGTITSSAITATGAITTSSTLTVTGTITGSSNMSVGAILTLSSGIISTNALTPITGVVQARSGGTSSQRIAFSMGSSGPNIQFGSSIPTSAALAGSIFMNVGGSSVQLMYVAVSNSGGASSSNWAPVTLG